MDDESRVVADLQARGLYDPNAADARDRLALLEFLLGLGATVADFEAAGDELPSVASMVVLRGTGERFCRAEAAERAGVAVDVATRLGRAAGLPDPGAEACVYSADDVQLLRTFAAGAQLLGEDAAFQLVRVIGSALARIADAEVAAFLTQVGGPVMAADPSGLELARANATAATLLRGAGEAIDVLLRRHVEVAQRPLLPGSQDATRIAIGFADLVGSTGLAEDLAFAELGGVIAEFETRAIDTIVDVGGRLVKFIGDAVMFIAPNAEAVGEIALRLVSQFSNHPRLPPVRVGIAFGDVLTRDGDYYGPIVNLAARLVRLAAPGEVLALGAVRAAVDGSDRCTFVPRGEHHLRGIRQPAALYVLQRQAPAIP